MPATALAEPISSKQQTTEVWFRRVFILFSLAAGLGIVCHLGLLLWAQNSFTGPECVVSAQALMLNHDGTLYYDLNHYPYTVSAYTPLFYLIEAGLTKFGLPVYTAGRMISFLAMLGILALSWRLVLLYTAERYCAAAAVLLCASSSLLLSWGTVGQVDTLAVFWAMAAFYQYSRYSIRGDHTLVWAGVFAVLAFFTKQTMIACPAAICVLLWFHRRKVAIQFGGVLAAAVLVLALSINTALGGRFLANTVLANLNPSSLDKLLQHLRFLLFSSGPLLLVAALGAGPAMRAGGRALFVYFGMAVSVLAVTAPKIGSDLNYQIEFTVLLILCACMGLHGLQFFRLSFLGSKTWITLLQLPVAVFLVVNYRITVRDLMTRVANEQLARIEVAQVRPYLADGGPVLSADYNAMVRIRGRLDVEMLIYKLLVDAGAVNPEPVRRDIAARAFSTILLLEDAHNRGSDSSVEISTLPAAQMEEIRKHYKLVEHIPAAGWNGVFVYKPAQRGVE